jgi:hypothetical protein
MQGFRTAYNATKADHAKRQSYSLALEHSLKKHDSDKREPRRTSAIQFSRPGGTFGNEIFEHIKQRQRGNRFLRSSLSKLRSLL